MMITFVFCQVTSMGVLVRIRGTILTTDSSVSRSEARYGLRRQQPRSGSGDLEYNLHVTGNQVRHVA